jgi:hypothetical protein
MAYINEGDLLVTRGGARVIALSRDYDRRVGVDGEYLEDWRIVPSVEVLYPESGVRGVVRLAEVKKISGAVQSSS